MTCPDILASGPLSNKRKRLPDPADEGANKLMKSGGIQQRDPKRALRIVTDITALEVRSPTLDDLLSSADSDTDSLFDESPPLLETSEMDEIRSLFTPTSTRECFPVSPDASILPARRTAPPIPGLYFDPSILLPEALGDDLMWKCIRAFFQDGTANQVMLFERSSPPSSEDPSPSTSTRTAGLPSFLTDLVTMLHDILRPLVPPEAHDLLFSPSPASHTGPPRARQAIINLYWPGEGITPHVDLLDRYGDGIMGVSLGSGCAMEFAKQGHSPIHPDEPCQDHSQEKSALYLPKGSVVVMTEDARYKWTHGIEKRLEDLVEETPGSERNVVLERDMRLSITFRWLLPGADIVGSTAVDEDS